MSADSLLSLMRGSQGKSKAGPWRQELIQSPLRRTAHSLALMACLVFFLTQPRTTYSGVALPISWPCSPEGLCDFHYNQYIYVYICENQYTKCLFKSSLFQLQMEVLTAPRRCYQCLRWLAIEVCIFLETAGPPWFTSMNNSQCSLNAHPLSCTEAHRLI